MCIIIFSVAEQLERWICTPEAPNPRPRLLNTHLVCILPVRILNQVMFRLNHLFHFPWKASEGERIIKYLNSSYVKSKLRQIITLQINFKM